MEYYHGVLFEGKKIVANETENLVIHLPLMTAVELELWKTVGEGVIMLVLPLVVDWLNMELVGNWGDDGTIGAAHLPTSLVALWSHWCKTHSCLRRS